MSGLGREIVFAGIIGRNALSDAYNGANSSPNAVYELLLGGVLSATLVPAFTRHYEDGDEEATNAVVSTVSIALVVITTIAVLAAPLIFRLNAIVVSDGVDPERYRSVGTALARIFLIQIFFYGLSAVFGALLNSRRRFFAQAWAPVLSNVAIIGGLVVADRRIRGGDVFAQASTDGTLRLILGLGATIGIALMAVAQFPALRPAGIRLRFRPDFRHPAVRKVATMSGWTFGYAAANVRDRVPDRNLARPGSGDRTRTPKAYTVIPAPPRSARDVDHDTFVPSSLASSPWDRDGFVNRASLGIRLVALLTFPASAALFALRRPIVGLLFAHGKFTAADALVTSRALGGFAIGLIGFSRVPLRASGFCAHQDAHTVRDQPRQIHPQRDRRDRVGRPLNGLVDWRSDSPISSVRCGHSRSSTSRCRDARCVRCSGTCLDVARRDRGR
ncbi:MAG: lipid II flippase MurJ [Ilumatobacteraceae bacterium]